MYWTWLCYLGRRMCVVDGKVGKAGRAPIKTSLAAAIPPTSLHSNFSGLFTSGKHSDLTITVDDGWAGFDPAPPTGPGETPAPATEPAAESRAEEAAAAGS